MEVNMENTNFLADLEGFYKWGLSVGDSGIIKRWMKLNNKISLKDLYDRMIKSGIKFPGEFTAKSKFIIFENIAGTKPKIFVKGKKIVIDRNLGGKTKQAMANMSVKSLKRGIDALKGAAAGEEVTLVMDGKQYFDLVSKSMFELLYNEVTDKQIQSMRKLYGH